jgi:hypothetical protein
MNRHPPTPTTTIPELVIRHFMAGLSSSEEINHVQLVGPSFAAVEEDRGVLRFEECLGGLWRLFGFFSRLRR